MISRTVGWLTLFVIGTDLFVMSPLLPAITRDAGIAPEWGEWAVTAFAAAYLVGGPALGALADRRSARALLLTALAVFAAANVGTALAPGFGTLLVTRALAGLAASGITPTVYALVGAAAPARARASWLAVVTSGLLVALATGAPAGALLAGPLGWRGVFVVLAAAALAVLACCAVSVHGGASRPAAVPATPAPATSSGARARVRAVSVTALWALSLYGLYTALGTVLDGLGFSPQASSVALACFGVAAVVGNLLGGRLADRVAPRTVAVTGLLALAGAQVLLAVVLPGPNAVVVLVLVVVAVCAYPYFPAQQVRIAAAFPGHRGSVLAWNNSAMYAGILVGSAGGGFVLARVGSAWLAVAAGGAALVGAGLGLRSVPARSDPVTTTAG